MINQSNKSAGNQSGVYEYAVVPTEGSPLTLALKTKGGPQSKTVYTHMQLYVLSGM